MANFDINKIISMVKERVSSITGIFGKKSAPTPKDQSVPAKPTYKPLVQPYADRAALEYKKTMEGLGQSGESLTEEQEAIIFAKSVHLQFLKSPSTAVFADDKDFIVSQEADGIYTITGYVDAQNSYGAVTRDNFKIYAKKENGVWTGLTNSSEFTAAGCIISLFIIGLTISVISWGVALIYQLL